MNQVIVKNIKENIKTHSKNEFLWYDNLFKKMLTFKCDYLDWKYVDEDYILDNENNKIPVEEAIDNIVDYNKNLLSKDYARKILEDNCIIYSEKRLKPFPAYNKSKDNKNISIEDWYKEFLNYNDSSAELVSNNEEEVYFSIKKEDLDDFCYDLERKGFNFTINNNND